jgi:hypothetical protein
VRQRAVGYPANWPLVPRFLLQPSRLVVGIIACLLGYPFRAVAQDLEFGAPVPERTRLEYRAPAECPDAEAFKALIRSRVPADWEAAPGELARRIDVTIARVDDRYVASIEFVDEGGERVAREVSGRVCSDATDGIALVTALAIHAGAADTFDDTGHTVAPFPEKPPVEPPPERARAATPPAAPRVEPAADQPPVGLRVSARAALTTSLGLTAAPGAALGIVYERWNARFGVALQGFWTGQVEARTVPVRFQLLAARLEGCPFVLVIARWATVEPCPFADLGAVTGEAFAHPPAVFRGFPGSALWLSLGGAGRLVGEFGALAIELEALFGVPLPRERFYVEGGDELHRLPGLYGGAAAGIGVRF